MCIFSRPNPPGAISGRQLGDAAHRLVVNSLQVRGADRTGHNNWQTPPLSHTAQPYIPGQPPPHSHRDYRSRDQAVDYRMPPGGRPNYSQGHHNTARGHQDHGYRQPLAGQHHRDMRHHSQHYNTRAHNQVSSQHYNENPEAYYPSSASTAWRGHSDVPPYHHNGPTSHHPPTYQSGYNYNQRPAGPGSSQQQQHHGGAWQPPPPANHGAPHHQYGNKYSVLDRRGNGGPPSSAPHSYGRRQKPY